MALVGEDAERQEGLGRHVHLLREGKAAEDAHGRRRAELVREVVLLVREEPRHRAPSHLLLTWHHVLEVQQHIPLSELVGREVFKGAEQ